MKSFKVLHKHKSDTFLFNESYFFPLFVDFCPYEQLRPMPDTHAMAIMQ